MSAPDCGPASAGAGIAAALAAGGFGGAGPGCPAPAGHPAGDRGGAQRFAGPGQHGRAAGGGADPDGGAPGRARASDAVGDDAAFSGPVRLARPAGRRPAAARGGRQGRGPPRPWTTTPLAAPTVRMRPDRTVPGFAGMAGTNVLHPLRAISVVIPHDGIRRLAFAPATPHLLRSLVYATRSARYAFPSEPPLRSCASQPDRLLHSSAALLSANTRSVTLLRHRSAGRR